MRRRLAWLVEQVERLLGIVDCLPLMLVLLQLVPLFELYDDVCRAYEDRQATDDDTRLT